MLGLTHKLRKRVCNMTNIINENQKKGAVSDTAPNELSQPLNANNTAATRMERAQAQWTKLLADGVGMAT